MCSYSFLETQYVWKAGFGNTSDSLFLILLHIKGLTIFLCLCFGIAVHIAADYHYWMHNNFFFRKWQNKLYFICSLIFLCCVLGKLLQ